jgi:hypothetical protein
MSMAMVRMVAASVLGFGLMAAPGLTVAADSTTDEKVLTASAESGSGSQGSVSMAPAAAAGGGAAAQDKWHFSVTPLSVWAFNIEGPACVKGLCLDANASFGDVKDKIDGGGGIGFEFGKGNWTGMFTASKIKFNESDKPVTLPDGTDTFGDVNFELDIIEAGIAYRLHMADSKSPKVELLGGARFTKLKLDAFSGPGDFSEDRSISWTDPFFGMRLAQPFGGSWAFITRADVGGFGATAHSSKMTWNFTSGLGYQWKFTGWGMNLFGGYKAEELDYRDDDPQDLQVIQRWQGPVLALAFTW